MDRRFRPTLMPTIVLLAIFFLPTSDLSGFQVVIRRGFARGTLPATIQQVEVSMPAAQQVTPDAVPGGATATGAPAISDETLVENELLTALLAAKYDRTTESLLKAWNGAGRAKSKQPASKKQLWIQGKVARHLPELQLVVIEVENGASFAAQQVIRLRISLPDSKTDMLPIGVVLKTDDNRVFVNLALKTAKPINNGDESQPDSAPAEGDIQQTDVKTIDQDADESWPLGTKISLFVIKDPNGQEQAKKLTTTNTIASRVEQFQRNVVLGHWQQVKQFLASMEPNDADKVYAHVLNSLANASASAPEGVPPEVAAQMAAQAQRNGQIPPASFLTPDDILALTEAAPKPIQIVETSNRFQASKGDPISGMWQGKMSLDGTISADISFRLQLSGNQVRGEFTFNGETVEITKGRFDMSNSHMEIVITDVETNESVIASGKLSAEGLTGKLMVGAAEEFSFTARRTEPAAGVVAQKPKASKPPMAATRLPANVVLPRGVTVDSLPAEALRQLNATDVSENPTTGSTNASHIEAIAKLIRNSEQSGHDFSGFVSTMKNGTTHFGMDNLTKRLTSADALLKAGLTGHVQEFLPGLESKETKGSVSALKLWSQLSLKNYATLRVAEWLDKAWTVNQLIVVSDIAAESDKQQALSNLIELSSQVDKEIGVKWMEESFTDMPERGMTILTNLGTKSASMASQPARRSESERLKLLRLQNEAAEKLIKVSPEKANEWKQALTLLANNWLTEADTSLQHSQEGNRQSFMQIDMYGNYYWEDRNRYNQRYGGRPRPRPIKLGDVLQIAPGDQWRKLVSPSLQIRMRNVLANLHLRLNEEDLAFPYIEQIAKTHPKVARELVHEFLRIWTRNHDPNTERRQRNPYIYMYGFDQKAEAIPLTRSKQERNLEELTQWVNRIRTMKLANVDENLLANAFTTCHSSAEVFELTRVRQVFGDFGQLKPETVASICQKMRKNLGTNWRSIREQEAKQTKRREPEVQQQVLNGYLVAKQLANEALQSSPDNWQLHLAKACLMFDENAYAQSVQKSSDFSDRRDRAFSQFQVAAEKYQAKVSTLEKKDQKTDVYDYWYYAAMGASELANITDKTVPDLRQFPKIRQAIDALPNTMAEVHMAKFANNLFTRMSSIKPEIKFRYLRAGFEIVGDHPRAWEAKNLYQYYKDLVSEIKLDVEIDGDDKVGHSQPFGIFVSLLHTPEIERESGGFGKYAQNQNSLTFAYNYGRPTEDYRDKFSDSVSQALGEHFEILNVTFQSPDNMKSVPTEMPGWRKTPYAYVLIKPLGSEIDRIAPLKLDLDFLDTSGYVVIPVESSPVIVDASMKTGTMRPVSDLKVTQTLDERQAEEGKLIVEISASGKGLIPELDSLVDVKSENFRIVDVEDQGVLPSAFDKDSSEIQIVSDRSWIVEYEPIDGQTDGTDFAFGKALLDEVDMIYQRYVDADLVKVDRMIELEESYATGGWNFLYWLIPTVVLGLVGIGTGMWYLNRPTEQAVNRFEVPSQVNPFTVLTLLNRIKLENGISAAQATELDGSIRSIERRYFGDNEDANVGEGESHDSPQDLSRLAHQWVERTR